jgi:hypothetical protein
MLISVLMRADEHGFSPLGHTQEPRGPYKKAPVALTLAPPKPEADSSAEVQLAWVLHLNGVKKTARQETNRKYRAKKAAERKKREEKEVGVGEGRNGKQAPTNDTINAFYSRIAGVSPSKYPFPEPSAPDAPKAIGEQVLDWLPDLLKQVASEQPLSIHPYACFVAG